MCHVRWAAAVNPPPWTGGVRHPGSVAAESNRLSQWPQFELDLAGVQRRVVQIKTIKKGCVSRESATYFWRGLGSQTRSSPQRGSTSSCRIALIRTTRRQIPASSSSNQSTKNGDGTFEGCWQGECAMRADGVCLLEEWRQIKSVPLAEAAKRAPEGPIPQSKIHAHLQGYLTQKETPPTRTAIEA